MKKNLYFLLAIMLSVLGCSDTRQESGNGLSNKIEIPDSGPIKLHPENPHYFLYKGKPLVLVTSGEHYGALLNLDFDYRKYLETLYADGMNYTRIFTGIYFELPGQSFNIKYNTLAPEKDKRIDDLSGNFKYDLTRWNEAYFKRLKDLMSIAASHDIIIEVTLFTSIYRDEHWEVSPQNPENNINIRLYYCLK